jgi:hypothetical protein
VQRLLVHRIGLGIVGSERYVAFVVFEIEIGFDKSVEIGEVFLCDAVVSQIVEYGNEPSSDCLKILESSIYNGGFCWITCEWKKNYLY